MSDMNDALKTPAQAVLEVARAWGDGRAPIEDLKQVAAEYAGHERTKENLRIAFAEKLGKVKEQFRDLMSTCEAAGIGTAATRDELRAWLDGTRERLELLADAIHRRKEADFISARLMP